MLGQRSGDDLCVAMAFDDLEICLKRGVVERVRYLTKPAAHIWDDAALAKLAAFDKSASLCRSSDVLPEAEDLARRDLDPIQPIDRQAQILYLSRYEWTFLRFIFLFGAEYERTYVRSDRRMPLSRSEFAMLPLGLFEIDSGPEETEVSVLWFIDWSWSN